MNGPYVRMVEDVIQRVFQIFFPASDSRGKADAVQQFFRQR